MKTWWMGMLQLALMTAGLWGLYGQLMVYLTLQQGQWVIMLSSAVCMAWNVRQCARLSRSQWLAVWRLQAMVATFLSQLIAILGQGWSEATWQQPAVMSAILGLTLVSLAVRFVPTRWRGHWLGR